jgi:hypothetical protein
LGWAHSGTGDLSTTGDCSEDIERFCPEVKPGEGRINECLTNQQTDEDAGKSADSGGKLSDKCKEEVRAFKAERSVSSTPLTPTRDITHVEGLVVASSSMLSHLCVCVHYRSTVQY